MQGSNLSIFNFIRLDKTNLKEIDEKCQEISKHNYIAFIGFSSTELGSCLALRTWGKSEGELQKILKPTALTSLKHEFFHEICMLETMYACRMLHTIF